MRLGQGFDNIAKEFKETAVFLMDTVNSEPGVVMPDATLPAETSLKGRVTKIPESPAVYSLQSFESLDQLHRMVSVNASLSAVLPQVNLSLSVNASKENRVDATRIYYLLVINSVENSKVPVVLPNLNQAANISLGLSSSAIDLLTTSVTKDDAALKKAIDELAASTTAKTAAQNIFDTTDAAWQLANQELLFAIAAGGQNPQDTILKAINDLRLKVFQTNIARQGAQQKLNQANQDIANKTATRKQAMQTLDASTLALTTARTNAIGVVDDVIIKRFYQRFGTHYIGKVSYGRQLVALITLDRSEVSRKSKSGVSLQAGSPAISAGGNIQDELENFKTRAVIDIYVASEGLRPVSLKNIKNIDDLQTVVLEFFDLDNYMPEPAPIDFELRPYSEIFWPLMLPQNPIDTFGNKIREVEALIQQLLTIRATAIRYYSYHDFHQDERNGIQAAGAPDLTRDPHNVRLQYLFNRLKQIIAYINDVIKELKQNIFIDKSNLPNNLVNPNTANITDINLILESIKNELQERAFIKILALHTMVNVQREYKVPLRLSLILGASIGLYLSSTDRAYNQITNIPQAASVIAPLVNTYVNSTNQNTNQANIALSWEPGLSVKVELKQEEIGFLGIERKEEILSAKAGHNKKIINKHILQGSSQFYLKVENIPRGGLAALTARVALEVPIDLDTLSPDARSDSEQKVRMLALPDHEKITQHKNNLFKRKEEIAQQHTSAAIISKNS